MLNFDYLYNFGIALAMIKNVYITSLLVAASLGLSTMSLAADRGTREPALKDLKNAVTAVFIGRQNNPLANPVAGLERDIAVFKVDGLRQYALVLQPRRTPPGSGWPVVIFNHGFHPTPHDNGRRTEDGVNDRPGDYYRLIPAAIARAGFLVVSPDYRGHNDSEGIEFVLRRDSPYWYARDVQGAFAITGNLDNIDPNNVFMLGHSMGAAVTLRAAAVLGDKICGASLWSAALIGPEKPSTTMQYLSDYNEKDVQNAQPIDLSALACALNIHHAVDDPVTAIATSTNLVEQLQRRQKVVTLFTYDSPDHLFTDANLASALARDIEFFRRIVSFGEPPQQDANAPLPH